MPAQIQAYYSDEHALTLGCATAAAPVSQLSSSPGAAYYPQLGDPACIDPSGRPTRPSLFITDITADSSCTAGDQQAGGIGYDPVAVFGTWKDNGGPDPAANMWTLGPGADAVPTSVSGNQQCNQQDYGAEVRYEAGLISGHSYRLQIMFHDGDHVADAGEACAIFCAGAGSCTPSTCGSEECGQRPDGCGGTLDCGPCCTPQTCGAVKCGQLPDGCGGALTCGPACGGIVGPG